MMMLIVLIGCGKDGKNGANGINGKDGANGKDLIIESKTYCSAMFNDHPDYYGVYPRIEITFFTNKTFMVHASVAINDSPTEFQRTSDTVWGNGDYFPFVSVLNIEYWEFNVENNLFTFSNQSGSYKKTFSNCY